VSPLHRARSNLRRDSSVEVDHSPRMVRSAEESTAGSAPLPLQAV